MCGTADDTETEVHSGSTGTRGTPGVPVVGGQVLLHEASADLFPPGMESPFPIKSAMVRMFDPETPGDREVWTQTDGRGVFGFDAAAVGGRRLADLAFEIFARSEGHIGACYESRFHRWSFIAAQEDVGEHVDVRVTVGPSMAIQVPESRTRDEYGYMTIATGGSRDTLFPGPTPGVLVYRAFYAFAFVSQMRSWLYGQRGSPAGFHLGGEVNIIYPANFSWSMPGNLLYLDCAQCTTEEYRNSWVAHEFGHHIFHANAPLAARVGGSHTWYVHSFDPDSAGQYELRGQLARDFSEGFATFVGQSFLQTPDYVDVGGGSRSIETASAPASERCCFGDYDSAAYFWDLADDRADGETAALGFTGVMRAFKRFADERADRYLTVPDFHKFLVASGTLTEAVALGVLTHNELDGNYRDWFEQIPANIRNGHFPAQPGDPDYHEPGAAGSGASTSSPA